MVNDVFRDAYDIDYNYGKYNKINPHHVDSVDLRAT